MLKICRGLILYAIVGRGGIVRDTRFIRYSVACRWFVMAGSSAIIQHEGCMRESSVLYCGAKHNGLTSRVYVLNGQ